MRVTINFCVTYCFTNHDVMTKPDNGNNSNLYSQHKAKDSWKAEVSIQQERKGSRA